MTEEEPKRLKPTPNTLRELFLKSGNLCAFPGCGRLMMNQRGDFVGEVCHIEGVRGERFNPDMTNEDRRHFSNLMLMCHDHHTETNDETEFTVEKMVEIKSAHERRFSHPDRAILEQLKDWTTVDEPVAVQNLQRYNEALDLGLALEECAEIIAEINEYAARLSRVPIEVRRFVCKLAQRIHRLDRNPAADVMSFSARILASDVEMAFKLDPATIRDKIAQLEAYALGGLDQMDSDVGPQPAIYIRALRSGLHLWLDVVAFCEATNTPIERFSDDMDFSVFDA